MRPNTHSVLLALSVAVLPFAGNAQSAGCLLFDGADDDVEAPNTALNAIGLGDFTLEAWVRGDEALQVEHPRILANTPGLSSGLLFFFHGLWGGSTVKMLGVQIEGTNYIVINNGTLGTSLLDGTCHHVAVSRDADTLRYYADGVEFGTREIYTANPTVASASPTMWIGNDDGAGYGFKGNISQVRIWNYTRSAAQIMAAHGSSLVGTTPGLVGYWELNEGSGQVAADGTTTANGSLGPSSLVEPADPAWSNDCCAVSGVGLGENSAPPPFHVFPNPASNELWIDAGLSHAPLEVKITDALGRLVSTSSFSGATALAVNIRDLPEGVYSITLRAGGTTRVQRFVKR